MIVEISNIKDEYHFQVNGKSIYFGSRYLLFFKNERRLYNEDRILVATAIFKRFSFFNIIIKLKYPNPAKIEVVTPLSFRFIYNWEFNGDQYKVVSHKHLKYSIFCNNVQIAYYQLEKLDLFYKSKITLYADDNINKDIIFAFILIVHGKFSSDSEIFSANVSSSNKKDKPFDEDWYPNKMKSEH